MKNKGFTLIELLAVIVILAIIALIATPIILGIINDSRQSAKDRSAEYVYEAVQLAYQTKYARKGSAPTFDELMAQIQENGLSNATLDSNVITTSDGVTCYLSNHGGGVPISIDCSGVSNDFHAPSIGNIIIATE